jgi:anti-sigma factor RsiW
MTSPEYQADGRFLSPFFGPDAARVGQGRSITRSASAGCASHGRELGPFMDGELDGVRMLRMSRHLDSCDDCAAALEGMQTVGECLRALAPADACQPDFAVLASSVVSRARAESSISWRATFARAVDGWHWVIVGSGAVAATFVSSSLVSFILTFGPAPQREDSLSAMATSLSSPAGFFFVYASASDEPGQDVVMLQVENGRPAAPPLVSELVVSEAHRSVAEAELVARLQDIIVRHGRVVSLELLGAEQRQVVEALLDEINRLRARDTAPVGRSFNVHEMRLVTSIGVSAKRS